MQKFKKLMLCILGACIYTASVAQPRIVRVEYYVDTDPGYGKAQRVNNISGNNISNRTVNVDISKLSYGVHAIGIRALDSLGAWSLDNTWIFYKQDTVVRSVPGLKYVEYYVDNDPGYGKAKAVNNISGNNISNRIINLGIDTLGYGVHIFGIRALDSLGAWSLDNTWVFYKQDTASRPTPAITYMEYYFDKDPGYFKAVPIASNDAKDYQNVKIFANISTLTKGKHYLRIRAYDKNNNWSYTYTDSFTVNTVVAGRAITASSIASKSLCPGGTVKVGYQRQGTFNAGNYFKVQMSDNTGSFANPYNLDSVQSITDTIINCTIPAYLSGKYYKIRVVSTNPALISANTIDSLVINNRPTAPTISPSGTVSVCAGNTVTLTASSGYTAYLWNTNAKTQSIGVTTSGSYTVTGADTNGCYSSSSAAVNVIFNPLPGKPTISASKSTTDLCPADSVKLTCDSTAASYLWNNGATTKTINVKSAGSYTVTVTNANGCKNTSDTTKVTYQSCTKPTQLKSSNVTLTTATLSWKKNACAASYDVQYKATTTTAWTSLNTVNNTVTITGLTPSTTYQWKVRSKCADGSTSVFANGTNFTTLTLVTLSVSAANKGDVTIIPNPTTGNATLTLSRKNEKVKIKVSDASGRTIWQTSIADNSIIIPSQKFASGIYVVSAISSNGIQTVKLIKE